VRTNQLGSLEISRVGLGCNNFGRRIDEAAARAVIDAALEAGVTFFDTANVYGEGASERFIGEALRGRRDRVVLATSSATTRATAPAARARRYGAQSKDRSGGCRPTTSTSSTTTAPTA